MTNYKAILDSTSISELLEIIGQKYPEGTLPDDRTLNVAKENSIFTVGHLRQLKPKRLVKLEFPVIMQREFALLIKESGKNNKKAKERKNTSSRNNRSVLPSTSYGRPTVEPVMDGISTVRDLNITIIDVRHQSKNTGTYVHLSILDGAEYKTSVVWGERSPSWGRTFLFSNVLITDVLVIRFFEIKKKKDKCQGMAQIRIRDLTTNTKMEYCLVLNGVNKENEQTTKQTETRVQINYVLNEMILLSTDQYNDLIKIISEPDITIIKLLEKEIKNEDIKIILKHIVNIFEYTDLAYNLFKTLIKNEIEKCDEPATLFRSDNLAIETLDYYLNLVGRDYLRSTLGPHIERIVTQQLDCELEQIKLDKNADLTINFENFKREAQLITNAIFSSYNSTPPQFRHLFHYLQVTAAQAFPCKVEVGLTAINGFLFLRFFVPAIMNPTHYGIWEGHLDARSLSTLTILARSIQKMANLTSFSRDREPHLHLINDFIKTNSRKLALYVSKITETPIDVTQDKQSKPPINVAKDAASIVNFFNLHTDILRKHKKDIPLVNQLLSIIKKINADTDLAKQQIKGQSSTSTTSVDENDHNSSNVSSNNL